MSISQPYVLELSLIDTVFSGGARVLRRSLKKWDRTCRNLKSAKKKSGRAGLDAQERKRGRRRRRQCNQAAPPRARAVHWPVDIVSPSNLSWGKVK